MSIAVMGLGLMGSEAALRLQRQGHRVVGWSRRSGRAQRVREAGIPVMERAADAIVAADMAILFLSDAWAIRETILAEPAAGTLAGRIVLQMSTIGPEESRKIGADVESHGGRYLECPVLGSLPEMREGRLILMAGGDPRLFAECLPVLKALGAEPVLIGEIGKAAALKLAMNQLIIGLTAAFSLSLGLVRAEGIDPESFMALLRTSALYAPTFDKKLPNYLTRDYGSANFPLKHLLKDLRLFASAGAAAGQDTSVLAALESACLRAQAQGFGDLDYSVLYEVLSPTGSPGAEGSADRADA